jgi:hypothetical protein
VLVLSSVRGTNVETRGGGTWLDLIVACMTSVATDGVHGVARSNRELFLEFYVYIIRKVSYVIEKFVCTFMPQI